MPKEGDQVLSFTANHILTRKEDSSFFIPFSDLSPNPTEPSNQRDYFFLGEHNGKRTYVASCEDRELSNYPNLRLTPARDALASADKKNSPDHFPRKALRFLASIFFLLWRLRFTNKIKPDRSC